MFSSRAPASLRELFPELKLVSLHIHAHPAKRHALHAQAEFLFSAIFSAQLDGAA
jgi:hypothetical protein